MSSDTAIRVANLSKCYLIYDKPQDRLKQSIVPRLQRLIGKHPTSYFREFWALKDVSFEVKKGETVGIIGRNGAGKSTLLQLICGTLTPTYGNVEVNGRVAALLELGSGFNPEFTGRENVYMNATLLGLSREEIDERFEQIVEFADIGDFIDQPIKMYSSGMVVRLAFAVSTCLNPDILVVDEALAVGDVKFQAKCFRRFEELNKRGTTILLVTHSPEQIVRHCDWAVLIDGGAVVMRGIPKDVVNKYLDMQFGVERRKVKVLNDDEWGSDTDKPVVPKEVIGVFEQRAGYNPHEYRWGNREAEIIDFCVSCGDRTHTTDIETGLPVTVTIWVKYHENIDYPIYGLTIKTPDGVTVFGCNSRDFDEGPVFPAARRGETVRVSFALRTQNLGTGDYLISVGVAELRSGEVVPLDRRYDSIYIHVMNRSSNAFGLADLSLKVEVTAV